MGGTMVFVFQVVCTGKEARLLECDFPENFGADYFGTDDYLVDVGSDYDDPTGDYNSNRPAQSLAASEPEQMENAPAPSGGLPNAACQSTDNRRLSVVCRRFEITGAPFVALNGNPMDLPTIAAYPCAVIPHMSCISLPHLLPDRSYFIKPIANVCTCCVRYRLSVDVLLRCDSTVTEAMTAQ